MASRDLEVYFEENLTPSNINTPYSTTRAKIRALGLRIIMRGPMLSPMLSVTALEAED